MEADLIPPVDVRGDQAAKAELDLVSASIVLVDRMDGARCCLIRAPGACEQRGRVRETRPRLSADGKPGRRRDVGPVQADRPAVDPAAAFRNRVLRQGKVGGVTVGSRRGHRDRRRRVFATPVSGTGKSVVGARGEHAGRLAAAGRRPVARPATRSSARGGVRRGPGKGRRRAAGNRLRTRGNCDRWHRRRFAVATRLPTAAIRQHSQPCQ